jgi:hypothetical protein
MTCPKCQSEIHDAEKQCPECGTGLYRNISGIIRTSAVMISADGEDSFYHSVQEVPERLRKRLMDTTAGDNSGTIVIADRAGKEQLTQALARRVDSAVSARPQPERPFADLTLPEDTEITTEAMTESFAVERKARLPWLAWVGFAAVLLGAAGMAAFFYLHW